MIGALFLLCLTGFTIIDMEFCRIHQAIESTESRTVKSCSSPLETAVLAHTLYIYILGMGHDFRIFEYSV